jgi:hypothetical protein
MTFDEFNAIVAACRTQQPIWFELETDQPASDPEIEDAQHALAAVLPERYRSFVKQYGGGFFALGNVFSVQRNSEWNVVEINRRENLLGSGFVAISDNYTGDLYGFRCDAGVCGDEIWVYDHDAGEWQRTRFADLFEFIHARSLKD